MRVNPINQIEGLAFQPPGGHILPYVFIGILLFGLAWWVYRRNPAPLSPVLRTVLWVLRGSAFLLLLVLICRPMISLGAGKEGRRWVALLMDASESLTLPAASAPGGAKRHEEAAAAVARFLPGLRDRHTVKVYGFDRDPKPLPDDMKLLQGALAQPSGDVTAMGPAFESVVSDMGRGRAGALVVVSDGVSNHGLDPMAVARRLALPVYAVSVGSDSVALDAVVARLRVNRTAFLGDEVPVVVTARNQGMTGQTIELSVVDVTRPESPRVVATQALSWAENGAEQEVRLKFRPAEVGLHFYEVRLPENPAEFTLINNRRMFALDVREEKSRVLLFSGSLTWDTTFLKRVLDADSSLSVTSLARLGGGWRRLDNPTIVHRNAWDRTSLGPYSLVVLAGVDASHLPSSTWEALADWVHRGGGLLVFGGPSSAGVNRLAGAAVAPLLPVDPQSASGGPSAVHAQLSAAGRRHPVTLVDENEAKNEGQWTDLPPLDVASSRLAVRSSAEVLASGSGNEDYPVLVSGRSGAGKILVAPAEGYWKWDFRLKAYREKGGFYSRLWTNAVRWLTAPDLSTRLSVEPGRSVFERGDAIDFSARLSDREYQPQDGAEVVLSIAGADSSSTAREKSGPLREITLTGQGGGFYSGETGSLPPGRYRFHAEARLKGERLGDVSGVFAVETMGLEFRRPAADPAFLSRLASETGGRAYPASDVEKLPEELKVQGPSSQEVVTLDVWDSPWFFVLFLGLVSTEWILRRRRGMV
jgi:hypothetical protein